MLDVCNTDECLVPPTEGTVRGDHLLVCASCIKEEFPDRYKELIEGNQSLMGCPLREKGRRYTDKIKVLIELRDIKRITVAMTEKSCSDCLRDAVREASLEKKITVEYLLIDRDGIIAL